MSVRHGFVTAGLDRAEAKGRATGVQARTWLDSPTYDHMFRVVERCGRRVIEMVPGQLGYDPDWWEPAR